MYSQQIMKLPSSTFTKLCDLTFHLDAGANCGSVRDKKLFYFFIDTPSKVKTVSGSSVMSTGWGGILCKIGESVCLASPVYYCPNNPRNTWSCGFLLDYGTFNDAIVSTHKDFTLVDHKEHRTVFNINVSNDLDYINVSIMSFQHCTKVIASNIVRRRSPRLRLIEESQQSHNIQPSNTKHGLIFPFDPKVFLLTCKKWNRKHHFKYTMTINILLVTNPRWMMILFL